MITVALVDDQPAVRCGLRMRLALEPDLVVVGEAGDGAAALDLVARLHPNIVVMDVAMPVMDGLSATALLDKVAQYCAVIMLSIFDDAATRRRALDAGALLRRQSRGGGGAADRHQAGVDAQPPGEMRKVVAADGSRRLLLPCSILGEAR
ncbi:MAG: hypothetical protein NVSMB65_03470 [Chloroflexota bacterium]